jgi:hypothetical protein
MKIDKQFIEIQKTCFSAILSLTLTTRFHVGKEARIRLFITVKVCIRYSWQNRIIGSRSSCKQRERSKKKTIKLWVLLSSNFNTPQILKIILAFRLCAIKINPNFLILSHPLPLPRGGRENNRDPNKMCTLLIFAAWNIQFSSEAAAAV